ncbi:hypothetical protein SBA3_510019 [Candidatus Sulfopaludibacter sp. SbA3]|nr:hypothetical protein SBA3_510019 [Candidatus Sulfopaludibacter sp. SbA3]
MRTHIGPCVYGVLGAQGQIGGEERLLAGAKAARLFEKPNVNSRPDDAGFAAAHLRPGFHRVTASEEASRNRSTLPFA